MKHFTAYITIASLFLVSCSETYNKDLELYPTLTPRFVNVSTTDLSFSSKTSSQSLDINSMDTPWEIENGIQWLSISPISGVASSSITVTANENTTGDEARTGIFYLKANVNDWDYKTAISATQAGAIPNIGIGQKEITMSGSANVKQQQVTANCNYDITKSEQSNWLSITREGNLLTLSATANESNSHRTATVTLLHNGTHYASTNFTVTQAPANINASTETLTFNNTAGSVSVNVNSEAPWATSTSDSWIEVSPSTGTAGTPTLTISVSPNTSINDRTGYIILSIGGEQRIQIPIRQRGIYTETKQTELSFGASGGTSTLNVLSNTSWSISSVPSWIKISPNSGKGDTNVNVTAEENPYTESRSGTIRISQVGLNMETTVNVTQKGKTFDVNSTVLNFSDKQETQTISIKTDGTWSATTSADWITISPNTATGNSTLSISVSENANDKGRNGSVTVTMGDKSVTINVVQQGKYLKIENNLLTYTSKGGNIMVSITANSAWKAKVEDGISWLSLSSTSGKGNANINISATDNPSANSRTGTIVLETQYNPNVKIMVNQNARYLTIDTNELLFYSKGGTSKPVTVSTDGTFNISCKDSWLIVSRTGNTFIVKASENTTANPRLGTVTISLTDLKVGTKSLTLPITQLNYGGSFLRKDYDADKNYDSTGSSSIDLTIKNYGTDSNYDTTDKSHTTLSISKYNSDKNWN